MSYKRKVITHLKAYFDIEENPVSYPPLTFEFQAEYREVNQKYILSKEWVYEECNSNEYIFFIRFDSLLNLHNIKKTLADNYKQMIKSDSRVNHNHMSSYITLLIEVAKPPPAALVREIEKFNFYKSFLFGFKGWVNAKLIVIESGEKRGYANRFGRKDLPKYLQMI